MATLNLRQKRFLVERLACFDAPTEAADAFLEEYGIRLDRRQVHHYNAANPRSRQRMAAGLVEHFDKTRTDFIEKTEGIAIAHKAYRLRRLGENERDARRMQNIPLSNACLEQAAKEVGDAYARGAAGTEDDPSHVKITLERVTSGGEAPE